ncbi:hypothetical protein HPB47_008618 [Ixodes persulcatus]|uniref:Uncharacterized protein n=1 Tax=Ixodes persulcatus TaxID=34615 RepID=A0AC60P452_IXOPE|nr:hypothetical protein HPB47_008618 [Ixodes persulcatus]
MIHGYQIVNVSGAGEIAAGAVVVRQRREHPGDGYIDATFSSVDQCYVVGFSVYHPGVRNRFRDLEGAAVSNLSHYFYQKLGFDTDEEAVHVLEEPTLDGIVRYIHGGKCESTLGWLGPA